MRASLTCKEAWGLYWQLQGRVRALRAKNVQRRRKRQALFAQLQASRGLEVLSLVNVLHPCSSECIHCYCCWGAVAWCCDELLWWVIYC